MSKLFSPLRIRGVEFKNRIGVSPMCQYSSVDGAPTDWHLVHLGARAAGGAGFVLQEATAVSPEGRISPEDAGIWSAGHAAAYERIVAFGHSCGCVMGIQLAHAGRKASTFAPWRGSGRVPEERGGWKTLAPSAIPFAEGYPHPAEMTGDDCDRVAGQFREAAARSVDAGFDFIELHMAHGYLLHEFLSPLSNQRKDGYGGSLENRMRFPLRVAEAVRRELPDTAPLFARVSSTDWVDGGWEIGDTVTLAGELRTRGVDLIDCSSGGNAAVAAVPVGPGYQTEFAERVRREAGILTAAVGLITAPEQAETILKTGQADVILLAREMLRDPYWPLHAAKALRAEITWPDQYLRAR